MGETRQFRPAGFRVRLVVAMMLLVSLVTALVLYFAQRNLAEVAERDLERDFREELVAQQQVQSIRQAALLERCRALVRKPRIHAALEDGALDLLYPSARDELRDIMEPASGVFVDAGYALHAEFYRFLDRRGVVIAPGAAPDAGAIPPAVEAALTLPGVPEQQQYGYVVINREDTGHEAVMEIVAMPITSTESGEVIAVLVLGFESMRLGETRAGSGVRRGLWLGGKLLLPHLDPETRDGLNRAINEGMKQGGQPENSFRRQLGGEPHLVFYKQLNPGAIYPAAYEVCVYSLADLQGLQRRLRWRVLLAGAVLLLGGLAASHLISGRLSAPVMKLAEDSVEEHAGRVRAEAALESTSEELQRAARFSADASHQLKTPVAVLRAGLEELQAHGSLSAECQQEISALVNQTGRLSEVIDDLLLLSRLDAGRLKLKFGPVKLAQLIEAALDDLGAQPEAAELAVEVDVSADLLVTGDRQYLGLILQNLMENARKYNQPGGRIRLVARQERGNVVLTLGNTGKTIPPAAQTQIFERFHRGAMGENVPGYGLGLNLARELVRLHRGELRLVRSEAGWTEFEVEFPAADSAGLEAAS